MSVFQEIWIRGGADAGCGLDIPSREDISEEDLFNILGFDASALDST